MFSEQPDHNKITAAGWAYRSNSQGWLIYKNPRTGNWHTRAEAIEIVEARTDLFLGRLITHLKAKEGPVCGVDRPKLP